MFQPKTVYSVLKPIFLVASILGLTPFSIIGNSFKESFYSTAWTILVFLFASSYSIFSFLNMTDETEHGLITDVTELLNQYLNLASMMCGMLFALIYRKKILEVIHSISQIDNKFQNVFESKIKSTYKRSLFNVILGVVCLVIYIIVIIILDSVTFVDVFTIYTVGSAFAYVTPMVVTGLVDTQFCVMLLLLRRRFMLLNNRLEKLCEALKKYNGANLIKMDYIFKKNYNCRSITPIVTKTFLQESLGDVFEDLRIAHYKLSLTCQNLNAAYSPQLLCITINIFVTLVVTLFYWIKALLSDSSQPYSTMYILYSSNSAIYSVIQILLLTLTCSKTAKEARTTSFILSGALLAGGDLEFDMQYFSSQLAHVTVEFDACKIFIIDESLLLSIIGAITTYLIVVVQFEISSKS